MEDLQDRMNQVKRNIETNSHIPSSLILFDSIVATLSEELEAGNQRQLLATDKTLEFIHSTILPSLQKSLLPAKTAQSLADIGKSQKGRDIFDTIDCEILVIPVVPLLDNDDQDVSGQACRALANLCYENDAFRKCALQNGVLPKLESLLYKENSSTELKVRASGCLLNVMASWDDSLKNINSKEVASVMLGILEGKSRGEDLTSNALLILGTLVDFGLCNSLLEDPRACKVANEVLATTTSTEVIEMCLDLFQSQSESDHVKLELAHAGICGTLIFILNKHQNSNVEEGSRNIIKMACDLISLILTGDESMEYLFADGEGVTLHEMVKWLQNSDVEFKIAGAIGIGNFARNDSHCIKFVKKGVGSLLISLLEESNSANGDIRLQHAVLSALRNLAIHPKNKPILLKEGILDALLPAMSLEAFPVVFKLIGTLRMIVDSQEEACYRIGSDKTRLERIVTWCRTPDHAGVEGEANRLIAWIVRHSNNPEVSSVISKSGAYPYLLKMASSEHEVMQREAVHALYKIAGDCPQELGTVMCDKAAVTHFISTLETIKSEKVIAEMVQVILMWVNEDSIKTVLPIDDLKMKLNKLYNEIETEETKKQIKIILNLLK